LGQLLIFTHYLEFLRNSINYSFNYSRCENTTLSKNSYK